MNWPSSAINTLLGLTPVVSLWDHLGFLRTLRYAMTSVLVLQVLDVCSPVGKKGGRAEGRGFWGHPAVACLPTKLTLLTVRQTAETSEQQQSALACCGAVKVYESMKSTQSYPGLLNAVEQKGHFLMAFFFYSVLLCSHRFSKIVEYEALFILPLPEFNTVTKVDSPYISDAWMS